MPLADCILDLSKFPFRKLRVAGLFGQSQDVAQFLNFETVSMKVVSVEPGRPDELR